MERYPEEIEKALLMQVEKEKVIYFHPFFTILHEEADIVFQELRLIAAKCAFLSDCIFHVPGSFHSPRT